MGKLTACIYLSNTIDLFLPIPNPFVVTILQHAVLRLAKVLRVIFFATLLCAVVTHLGLRLFGVFLAGTPSWQPS